MRAVKYGGEMIGYVFPASRRSSRCDKCDIHIRELAAECWIAIDGSASCPVDGQHVPASPEKVLALSRAEILAYASTG